LLEQKITAGILFLDGPGRREAAGKHDVVF
jgi:hypothetical protein